MKLSQGIARALLSKTAFGPLQNHGGPSHGLARRIAKYAIHCGLGTCGAA
jgi:hypothetical protein